MARPRVYVTRRVPPPGLELLSEECEVTVFEGEGPPDRSELMSGIRDRDGLLCTLSDRVDSEVLASASNLKVVSSFSVGVDHIDVAEATRMGIYVTYTPEVLTDATADMAFTLMLAAARRVAEADRYVRSGRWRVGWSPTLLLGEGVYGKTLGIVGLGRIGGAVAHRAAGFGMRIIYYGPRRHLEKERELSAEYKPLEDLLRESDFVSLHLPLTRDTYRLIGREELRLMKRSAILVNTSRGQIVDEEALVEALKEGWIAGAGLDVYWREPVKEGSGLLDLENVVLTPHIGSATREARSRMSEVSAKNLLAVLRGEEPLYLYNPDVKKVRSLSQARVM